ncbi:MAG: glycosyltransferase family 2 protein, partial [Clostridia bacterium]|nr:glycosyltransferase family 2 protein [Deltaproteobacteria bacterium]
MNVSVVVPVYRGALSIPELVERLSAVLPKVAKEYELVLVNDGSPDNSWPVIEELTERFSFVRGIDLMRNYGQHNALLCGVYSAKYDVIVTMDDDLQHPPEEIPNLLEPFKTDVDLVYGREKVIKRGFIRRSGSRAIKWMLAKLTGGGSHQDVGSYRAFRSLLRNAFPPAPGQFVILDSILASGTTKLTSVEVSHDLRKYGRSNYDISDLIRVAFRLITSYSVTPLRFAVVLGLLSVVAGLGFAIASLFASSTTLAIVS